MVISRLSDKTQWVNEYVKLPKMGHLITTHLVNLPRHTFLKTTITDLNKLFIIPKLHSGFKHYNKRHFQPDSNVEGHHGLTTLQTEMLPVMSSYVDLLFYGLNHANQEEIRDLYCLHAINHALKARSKIIYHNSKLTSRSDVCDEYRDQGLTRPKILILLPFRESALRVVKSLMSMLSSDDKADILNKKRFLDDFGDGTTEKPRIKKTSKPLDHLATFVGNCSDHFRIGISVTKKSLRLYTDFYSSDIIVASPLGLRMLIGAEGEKERDYDFISSIEMLIIDQADVLLMQNWDHLLHCLAHLHLQPKDAHGIDFSRVRMWVLNGWSRYYRQTLCFTSFVSPDVNGIFSHFCCNYNGVIRTNNPTVGGAIRQVAMQLPQVFQRFQV